MFGEIVEYEEHVAPGLHEVLRHAAGRIWGDPLQARRRIGLSDDENTSLDCPIAAHRIEYSRDR
jgi:hypothetical protein